MVIHSIIFFAINVPDEQVLLLTLQHKSFGSLFLSTLYPSHCIAPIALIMCRNVLFTMMKIIYLCLPIDDWNLMLLRLSWRACLLLKCLRFIDFARSRLGQNHYSYIYTADHTHSRYIKLYVSLTCYENAKYMLTNLIFRPTHWHCPHEGRKGRHRRAKSIESNHSNMQ